MRFSKFLTFVNISTIPGARTLPLPSNRHKDTSHLDTAVTLNPDPTTSHLLLSPVEFEHAGQYSCEAVFSGKSADSLAATFFVRGFEVHPEVGVGYVDLVLYSC